MVQVSVEGREYEGEVVFTVATQIQLFGGDKMPKCPKCGKEIDHLIYNAYELQKADFYVFDTNTEYSNWDSLGFTYPNTTEYHCPKCDELLFVDEDAAEKFLRSSFSGE